MIWALDILSQRFNYNAPMLQVIIILLLLLRTRRGRILTLYLDTFISKVAPYDVVCDSSN